MGKQHWKHCNNNDFSQKDLETQTKVSVIEKIVLGSYFDATITLKRQIRILERTLPFATLVETN